MNEITTISWKAVGDSSVEGTQSHGTARRYGSVPIQLLKANQRRQPKPYVFCVLSWTLCTIEATTLCPNLSQRSTLDSPGTSGKYVLFKGTSTIDWDSLPTCAPTRHDNAGNKMFALSTPEQRSYKIPHQTPCEELLKSHIHDNPNNPPLVSH